MTFEVSLRKDEIIPMNKEIFYKNLLTKIKSRLKYFRVLILLLLIVIGGVSVANAQCALACNNSINVSLPGPAYGCALEITVLMVVEDVQNTCPGEKTIEILTLDESVIPTSPVITSDYIGETLLYRVTHLETNNSCSGFLNVGDNLAPVITDCEPQSIHCFQEPTPVSEGGIVPVPVFQDCSSYTTSYSDTFEEGVCSDDYSARIIRHWEVTDTNGETASCDQTITIDRISLATDFPNCPPNVDLECSTADMPGTDPSDTGYPYFEIDGSQYDVVPGEEFFCEMASSYSDEEFEMCGGSIRILRTWTVYDFCTPTQLGMNPFTCIQIIEILDTQAPEMICASPIIEGSGSASCAGSVYMPPIEVFDDCSSFSVRIESSVGNINDNGGFMLGVPLGTHTVTYIATDVCGNENWCETTVTIEDTSPPFAICDNIINVSLATEGASLIYAETFDGGSSDNCSLSHLEVKRLETECEAETAFGESVQFSCCDVGTSVPVVLRVYDTNGNYNECTMEVSVEDELNPAILCPADVTIECDSDYSDLSVFGEPMVEDNCNVTYSEEVEMNISSCGVGTIIRTFTATDMSGWNTSCSQTITVINSNHFDGSQIVWPPNYTTYECAASVDPENLPVSPVNYQNPIIMGDNCDLMAVGYVDTYYPIAPPSCFEIVRRWSVIDWCLYVPGSPELGGVWTHDQIIKVKDDIPPAVYCQQDTLVKNHELDCGDTYVVFDRLSVFDCSPDITISFRIDFFQDGNFEVNQMGNSASWEYPMGEHEVQYIIADGCGNTSVCDFTVTVVDGQPPAPVCFNSLTLDLVPLPDGSPGGMAAIVPELLNAGSSDNCTAVENLQIEVSPSTFTCDNVGTNFVKLIVTDEAGNTDYCEAVIIIQDNMSICPLSEYATVAGGISNEEGESVEGVSIEVNGGFAEEATTGLEGSYEFSDLPVNNDYTFTPSKEDDYVNGVSTFDLVLMRKHITGVQSLDSPYKIIAADVNGSGTVSTLDMVYVRKLILQIDTVFANNTSWRFVPADYEFSDSQNPFFPQFPEVVNINNLQGNEPGVDFVAIKIGDVNGSASPVYFQEAENREGESDVLSLIVEDREVKEGTLFEVPFYIEEVENISGMQFTLEFDSENLEFVYVIENGSSDVLNVTAENFGLSYLEKGVVTMSWENPLDGLSKELDTKEKIPFFSLRFRAKTASRLQDVIKINSRYTFAECYDLNGEERGVELKFEGTDVGAELNAIELYQNHPNPFQEKTLISFYLPKAMSINLSLMDMTGRLLQTYQGWYEKGGHEISVNANTLGNNQILVYQLETPEKTISKKMILLK